MVLAENLINSLEENDYIRSGSSIITLWKQKVPADTVTQELRFVLFIHLISFLRLFCTLQVASNNNKYSKGKGTYLIQKMLREKNDQGLSSRSKLFMRVFSAVESCTDTELQTVIRL